ncbi:MAG TPA: hypothetical protein DDX54_03655 [Rhodospirillaceae bacterium]|jgi:hypothetical protein|nr:transglutaminase-like cysteine peptidase [Alphaproteobacteria bacterium]HBH26479.1 hypothetical protein [Rhodospirillaceae bacterium]
MAEADWPEPITDLVARIRAADSVAEKATITKAGVDALIAPQDAAHPWPELMMEELRATGRILGDCHQYAALYKYVLMQGGVPPEDVAVVRGIARFESLNPKEYEPEAHVVAVVRDAQGDLIYLDNNLDGIANLDPGNMQIVGRYDPNRMSPEKRAEYLAAGNPPVTIIWENMDAIEPGAGPHLRSPEGEAKHFDLVQRQSSPVRGMLPQKSIPQRRHCPARRHKTFSWADSRACPSDYRAEGR